MTVAFFAMIGMAVPGESVSGIREAIKRMAENGIKGPYIITFGNTPDEVYEVLTNELQFTDGPREGEKWQ